MASKNVIVRFRGRVGNQLFQYWTGYAVAQRLGAALWYEPSAQVPDLANLIPVTQADPGVLAESLGGPGWSGRWHRFRQRLAGPVHRSFWQDRFGAYDAALSKVETSCFLDGYWQSFRYFEHLPAEVFDGVRASLERLSLPDPWLEKASSSVVLHVRRTDFVAIGISLPSSYYQRAMERFPGQRFLVVTDDPGYCRELFSGDPRVEVVTDATRTAWQDMNLMVHAAGLVIANSTFSWWGAYLNTRTGIRVVTPDSWLAPEPGFVYNLADVYPPTWETL